MKSLFETTKNEWEILAKLDPLWAILGENNKRFKRWELNRFFATGEKEIDSVISYLQKRKILLKNINIVLDFGCGVGRLTRALAKHFPKVYGIDISEQMIKKAKKLNQEYKTCYFTVNKNDYLLDFPDNHFDFIYSNNVLQHFHSKKAILKQISDFIRVLKPAGIALFQLPSNLPFLVRLHPRRRLYDLLKRLGLKETFLYNNLSIYGYSMISVSVDEVKKIANNNNFKIVDIVNKQTIHTTYLLQKL